MKQPIVFVLGMHRSGTSLIAKGLEVLGADLGTHLMPPAADNPTGFWEDWDAYHLNQKALSALDLDWSVASAIPPDARDLATWSALIDEARNLLTRKLTGARMVAIKDPRFSVTLPLWLAAAEALELEPRMVLVVRNPLDVAASLSARNGWDRSRGLQLWLSANLALLQLLAESDHPVLCVSYERFLAAVEPEMARLARFVHGGPPSPEQCALIQGFAREFVAPELCHSRSAPAALAASEDDAPGTGAVYGLLADCCIAGWDAGRAAVVVGGVDPLRVEARNFRLQRHVDREARQRLERARDALHGERETLLAERDTLTQALDRLREEAQRQEERMRAAREAHEQALRKQTAALVAKRRETQHVQRSQQSTERHLNGALKSLEEIKASLSFRLGFGLTWPVRTLYDTLLAPYRSTPGNVRLMGRMLYYLVRHPARASRLLNRDRIGNAYLTFFRNPSMAREVVGHYARLLHGEDLPAPGRTALPARPVAPPHAAGQAGGRVSVITVNYNGKGHLDGLLNSLLAQDYDDLEIILVDNGSSDGSVDLVRECYPSVKVVALGENLGFAEANNIGAQVADGDYYCLINNDMELEHDGVRGLVSMMLSAPDVAAVGSKIRFWKPFLRLAVQVAGPAGVMLDREALEDSLPVYAKIFHGPGWTTDRRDGRVRLALLGESYLEVPVCGGQSEALLVFQAGRSGASVTVATHASMPVQRLDLQPDERACLRVDLAGAAHLGAARYLINNAGSEVDEQGNARDRGFAMPDDGSFDQAEAVTALCGGAMLIRAAALQDQPIFAGELFAYYEDTELSLRLRGAGCRLIYAPASVVYHKHASTSREHSAFFRYYVTRNHLLFQALHYPDSLWLPLLAARRDELNHLEKLFLENPSSPDERAFAQRIPELLEDWDRLLPRIARGDFLAWPQLFPRVAIYNGFWDTLGGGEHHAGVMALALQRFGPVELLSDHDFDMEALARQFDLDLKHCRKRIISAPDLHFDSESTAQYDLFINSSFASDLVCHARNSVYVVSFPFRLGHRKRDFLDSYDQFWVNSKFTAHWARVWWDVDSEVVYPSIRLPDPPPAVAGKGRRILHVGRFFRVGHSKKQLELVTAFADLVDSGRLPGDWRLTLVGKVHRDQEDYLHDVQRRAEGYNVDFVTDASFQDLHDLFRESAIYWHATGLGEKEQDHPELFEHFGISTVEAMSYGCVPIVIGAGGQLETVHDGQNGFLFDDVDGLKDGTLHSIELYEQDRPAFDRMSERAMERARQFSREVEMSRVAELVDAMGIGDVEKCRLL